jgi:hypothetical protein
MFDRDLLETLARDRKRRDEQEFIGRSWKKWTEAGCR